MAEKKTILNGSEEIKAVLGCGEILFRRYIKLGLPVKKMGRVLIAHRVSVEEFVKKISITAIV